MGSAGPVRCFFHDSERELGLVLVVNLGNPRTFSGYLQKITRLLTVLLHSAHVTVVVKIINPFEAGPNISLELPYR